MELLDETLKSALTLLDELGLEEFSSPNDCVVKIAALKLRQLDRLKIILSKLGRQGFFSDDIREGIRRNELKIFSEAVTKLNATALENAN